MTWNLLLISSVILLCILLHRVSDKIGVPMLLAFIVLGMAFGTDGIVKIPFENYELAENVCSTALIFIMFYGGFGTSWNEARPVAVKSVLLSTLGVVITAALTGFFCYFILKFSFLDSMLIGSVVSSTDAASVFSILRSKNMGLKYGTASMLELESGSNDPCSYMLTAVVLSAMSGTASAGSIFYMIFAQLFFGILFGCLIAFAARFILRHINFDIAGFDMAFVIAVALLSYTLPSIAGGNGYLSAYMVGIILGNTKIKNKKSLVNFFDGITGLMQMLIFFLLGLLATPSQLPRIFLPALAIALFLTLAARPLAVSAILAPFKCRLNQQVLVSFAGLRGAASIVFAIMATVDEAYTGFDVYHIVFCIVLLSILFQGSFLSQAAKKLNMSDTETDVMKTFSDYSEEADLQFIRIRITEEHIWSHKAVKDISLPPDTLFLMLLRGEETVIPSGETIFRPGDTAVLSARGYQEQEDLELTEMKITAKSPWIGIKISDFSPYPGELVIMILRGDETVVPKGDTIIMENDLLVIYSVPEYRKNLPVKELPAG
ncbi:MULTISPECIES: potassium/proton antiporter [Blautia]|uniref:potassium/proton antiporter n=1 Tax=Blautia TaxID=572511 RepID=UPI000BA2ED78|nr:MULTISPECIES: potassium/proton antiporter [Blautia]